MALEKIHRILQDAMTSASEALSQPETYTQLAIVAGVYLVAFLLARRIRRYLPFFRPLGDGDAAHPLRQLTGKLGNLLFPLLAIMLLRVSVEISESLLDKGWVNKVALSISVLLLFNSVVHDFVRNNIVAGLFRWIGMPILVLYLLGLLDELIAILESVSINIGNIDVSLYGVARVAIFGSLLFWLGRVSSQTGREIINRQEQLERGRAS